VRCTDFVTYLVCQEYYQSVQVYVVNGRVIQHLIPCCIFFLKYSLHLCLHKKILLCFNIRRIYFLIHFYARLAIAILSVRPSVRPSVTRVDQSKTVQARITKSSPSAAWKALGSGSVKLFHKFERGHPNPGAK